jgi:hypothetical protein
MRAMGLVWNLKQPADLPDRPELRALCKNATTASSIFSTNKAVAELVRVPLPARI